MIVTDGSGAASAWRIARSIAMTSATMPSMRSVDFDFEGLTFPAGSISRTTFPAIHASTGLFPCATRRCLIRFSRSIVGADMEA